MGLFDKKICDICGEKIGLLGNRKLDDGNMCSKCAKNLSPFTTDRKKTSLADIKEHLAYREANKPRVAAFRPSRQFGEITKVLVDDGAAAFIVSASKRWQDENPDVINISQVTDCYPDIRENRREITTKDAQGKTVSYRPPRYEYSYDFYMNINVNSPFFNEISFKLNSFSVERGTMAYRDFGQTACDIQGALKPLRPSSAPPAPAPAPEAAAPAGPKFCPHCGASAASAAGKFCEACGGALR